MERTKREDYRTLEKRKLDFVRTSGRMTKGVVAGCNRSVGISIVDENDPNNKLVCLNGPVTKSNNSVDMVHYNKAFDYSVGMILSGVWTCGELSKMNQGENFSSDGTMASCPYGT